MDLNEALAFATNAVPAPVQHAPQAVQQPVANNANVQAAAQVVQPTQTVMPQAPVQQTVAAPIQTMDLLNISHNAKVPFLCILHKRGTSVNVLYEAAKCHKLNEYELFGLYQSLMSLLAYLVLSKVAK